MKRPVPRTNGRFTRKGLVVNGLRYKNDYYTERYLKGGTCTVTYNPDDVTTVWLFEKQKYTEFSLIERCFKGERISDVENIKAKQKALIFAEKTAVLQAKIDLNNDLSVITETARNQRNNGATTLCETWSMNSSNNHHMFSEVDNWMYKYIGGLNFSEGELTINPIYFENISEVNVKYKNLTVRRKEKSVFVSAKEKVYVIVGNKKIELENDELMYLL